MRAILRFPRYNVAMKKRVLQLTVGVALLLVMGGVGEPLAQDAASRVNYEEFTAIARAQLETVHYMAHVFRAKRGKYPKSFYELVDSPYYVVDLANLYTGLPMEQIGFMPAVEDFTTGAVLPGGIQVPPVSPPEEQPPEGEVRPVPSWPKGEGGDDGELPPPPAAAQRRIEPARVLNPTPGDLIYWTEGDSLQLVIFSDAGSCEELWRPQPFNYLADLVKVTETTRPLTDPPVAELAIHLERMLPGMMARYLFLTTENAPTPRDVARKLKEGFPEFAATLSLTYANPLKKRAFMPATYYSPGDLAIATWLPPNPELMYYLQGNRVRTLDELIDAETLRANSRDIERRDRLVKAHAADMPEES